MDPIIEALKQFLGEYIVAIAVLIVALVWFIWWLSSKYHSIKNKVEKMDNLPCNAHEKSLLRISEMIDENGRIMNRIESRLDSLPCSVHSDKHDKHEERLNKSEALLHKMEGQLELLVNSTIVKSTDKIMSASGIIFSAKHSPRVLNENGIKLLNDFGGNEFLKENMELFIAKIEKLQPKTALDVENLSLAVLQAMTVEDMFIPIKNWIYNAPARPIRNPDGSTTTREITLNDAIFVLSIPIRDRYLEKHPMY